MWQTILDVLFVGVLTAVLLGALWIAFAAGSRRRKPAPWVPFSGGGGVPEAPPTNPREQ